MIKEPNPRRKSHLGSITAGRLKTTTKHMAALDFLSSISMVHEAEIKQNAIALQSKNNDTLPNDDDLLLNDASIALMEKPPDGPGRMLPGRVAHSLSVVPELRYKMKFYENRNEVKRWEEQTIAGGVVSTSGSTAPPILATRLFFSRSRAYPLVVGSIIAYDAGEEKARLENIRAGDTHGFEVFKVPARDWRGSSYQHKLNTSSISNNDILADEYLDIFDDREMRYSSGHRHTARGSAQSGPVISSIILYANEKDLRESVDEQFIDRYPNLPPSLNISAIRDLTSSLARCCLELNIELSTAALAHILFERLCLQEIITKTNRNLCMAVSVLLAFKFSECYLMELQSVVLPALFEFMDREWDVSKKEVIQAEFGAYILLNFALVPPQHQIVIVYNRLLKFLRLNSDRYLAGYTSNT